MTNQLKIPSGGSLVSRSHCIEASILGSQSTPGSIFKLHEKQRRVIGKLYFLDGDIVSRINIMLLPITQDGVHTELATASDQTDTLTIIPSPNSVHEMLESIGRNDEIKSNNVVYILVRKNFIPNNSNWTCELIARIYGDDHDFVFRRDVLSHEQFVRAARPGDMVSGKLIHARSHTQISTAAYSTKIITSEKIYESSRNIDFNHIFFIAAQTDHITIGTKEYSISHKLCDEKPSNSELFDAYLSITEI